MEKRTWYLLRQVWFDRSIEIIRFGLPECVRGANHRFFPAPLIGVVVPGPVREGGAKGGNRTATGLVGELDGDI